MLIFNDVIHDFATSKCRGTRVQCGTRHIGPGGGGAGGFVSNAGV